MEFTLKLFFFFIFLISAATGQFEPDSVEDPGEKSLQFHIDEHKTTREIIKSEMYRYFSDQWEKMMRSNSEMLSKLETVNGKLETVNGKLETVNGELASVNGKLETVNEKLEAANGKQVTANGKLEAVNGKLETVNRELESVNEKLETVNGKLEILNEKVVKIEKHQQELSSNLSQTLIKDVGINLSDSFNQRQTSSDLKTEKSLLNLSATLTQKC